MQSILITLALLLPPSPNITYTASDRARAERAAQQSRFVGPKLPPPSKAIETSLSQSPPTPKPKPAKPKRPSSPPPERFYIDGNYIRNSSGGVVAQFGACRSCAQVQAGIRLRRYPRQ